VLEDEKPRKERQNISPFIYKPLPPFQGLIFFLSHYPGLRDALRRFTPGYCSIGVSGAEKNV
jgi:hypothetical protein